MRKILFALLALTLSVGVAVAGWNQVQKPDGSTVWENEDGVTAHVAETYVTLRMTDLGAAASHYVTVPIAGKIETIYGVLQRKIGGDADTEMLVWALPGTGTGRGVEVSDGSFPAFTILVTPQVSGSNAGDVYTFTPTSSNRVTKGSIIAIESEGEANDGTANAMVFTIIINPN